MMTESICTGQPPAAILSLLMMFPKNVFQFNSLLFLAIILCFFTMNSNVGKSSNVGKMNIKCIENERRALLKLKAEIVDGFGLLTSWRAGAEEDDDCCLWQRVGCDNETGHITMLDLRGNPEGYFVANWINQSLAELHHLNYLDLSSNDLMIAEHSEFIGSLSKLKYLNVSFITSLGPLPYILANQTELETLDLSSYRPFRFRNLAWVSHLRSLRYLGLSGLNLNKATDWVEAIHQLPSLQELHLSDTDLPVIANIQSSLQLIYSSRNTSTTFLHTLDLSLNKLPSSSIYPWLFNFNHSLRYIDLSANHLQGTLPDNFRTFLSLEHLDLSSNHFQGGFPRFLGNLTGLKSLILSGNNLTGELFSVMEVFSGANTLKQLNLSWNRFNGSIPDISGIPSLMDLRLQGNQLKGFFQGSIEVLHNLVVLDASQNQLIGTLPDLSFFPSLRELYLDHNQFNTSLTSSIGCLSQLAVLYLGSNQLEGIITEAHFLTLSKLNVIDLSFNLHLELKLASNWIPPFQLAAMELGHLKIGPAFPKWLETQRHFFHLDMSNAGISDVFPSWFWDISPDLEYLNLSSNQIYGPLPDLPSKFRLFPIIDLRSNYLSGELPNITPDIMFLDLSQNKFTGSISVFCNSSRKIPTAFERSIHLQSLHLQNNYFEGEIPMKLGTCALLKVIDLGGNILSGNIPAWIGSSFPGLVVLILRSNEFSGTIPLSFCNLAHLQILDLSQNNFSGPIQKCISRLTAMTEEYISTTNSVKLLFKFPSFIVNIDTIERCRLVECNGIGKYFSESAFLTWKGTGYEYSNTLGLVKMLDLSSNFLHGEIPVEITSLNGLVGLNLSRNNFTGSIPQNLGKMPSLNFLDLSWNLISGSIPSSISELGKLGVLNLSYNNLSGRIPTREHFLTFDNSSYISNSQLCGSPLALLCPGDKTPQDSESNVVGGDGISTHHHEHEDRFLDMGFYFFMIFGFVFGFWGVVGTLVLKKSWRHTFFRSLNKLEDLVYVALELNKARLRR
ncbi:hypothetical protein ACH5RR_027804 [Cinchona calisaya]|uniref:Leucine-rich repeat-containing N-terminal plant-type domain-containing protein n=1 Tax=Cinchona calisaya TaxID=153742 RepID=A0ABD2YN52_9GENT